jgi:hypothetical protein
MKNDQEIGDGNPAGHPLNTKTAGMPLIRNTGRYQRGYLLEVPLLMSAAGIATALLWNVLPEWMAKTMLGFAILVWIGGLYSMLVMPGWQPGNTSSRVPKSWIFLMGIVLLIVVGLGLVFA